MSQIILGVLAILLGCASALATMGVLWANAIGGVTNASAANNWPALWLAILAVAGVVGGVALIIMR